MKRFASSVLDGAILACAVVMALTGLPVARTLPVRLTNPGGSGEEWENRSSSWSPLSSIGSSHSLRASLEPDSPWDRRSSFGSTTSASTVDPPPDAYPPKSGGFSVRGGRVPSQEFLYHNREEEREQAWIRQDAERWLDLSSTTEPAFPAIPPTTSQWQPPRIHDDYQDVTVRGGSAALEMLYSSSASASPQDDMLSSLLSTDEEYGSNGSSVASTERSAPIPMSASEESDEGGSFAAVSFEKGRRAYRERRTLPWSSFSPKRELTLADIDEEQEGYGDQEEQEEERRMAIDSPQQRRLYRFTSQHLREINSMMRKLVRLASNPNGDLSIREFVMQREAWKAVIHEIQRRRGHRNMMRIESLSQLPPAEDEFGASVQLKEYGEMLFDKLFQLYPKADGDRKEALHLALEELSIVQ